MPAPLTSEPKSAHDRRTAVRAVADESVVDEQAAGDDRVLAVQVHQRQVLPGHRRIGDKRSTPGVKEHGVRPVVGEPGCRRDRPAGEEVQNAGRLEVDRADLTAGPDVDRAAALIDKAAQDHRGRQTRGDIQRPAVGEVDELVQAAVGGDGDPRPGGRIPEHRPGGGGGGDRPATAQEAVRHRGGTIQGQRRAGADGQRAAAQVERFRRRGRGGVVQRAEHADRHRPGPRRGVTRDRDGTKADVQPAGERVRTGQRQRPGPDLHQG